MATLKVVLTVILTASVVYIFWCMYGAAKYMREHPDEWRWPDSPADSKVDARKMQGSGKVDEISKPVNERSKKTQYEKRDYLKSSPRTDAFIPLCKMRNKNNKKIIK